MRYAGQSQDELPIRRLVPFLSSLYQKSCAQIGPPGNSPIVENSVISNRVQACSFSNLRSDAKLHLFDCVLKIQRSSNGRNVFKLSGRIEAEDVKELRELLALEIAEQQLVLDLKDVTLVSQDVVEFLVSCEADSVKLENCPAYIRQWIEQAKGGTGRRRTR